MQNLKFLNEEGFEYGTLGSIEFFRIENCDKIDKFALLKAIYLADGSKLKNIRVVGFNYEGNADDVTMVANMAIDKDKDGNEHPYNGINQEGQIDEEMLPVIEGRLKVNGSIYEDDGKILKQYYPNLTLEVTGGYYVKFADPEVQRILVENFSADKVGMTSEDIAKVTGIGTVFNGNTIIETFDEFEKFEGVTSLIGGASNNAASAFRKSTIRSIKLPYNLTSIGDYVFYKCANLENIENTEKITNIGAWAFADTSVLAISISFPSLTSLGFKSFHNSGITSVNDLGAITSIQDGGYSGGTNQGVFSSCDNLTKVVLPKTLTSIGSYAFQQCIKLKDVVLQATTPPQMGNSVFDSTPIASGTGFIYVPDESVAAYREASGWVNYADRIFPISVYNEGGLSEQITFEDTEVEAICLANYDYNGNGYISKAEAASVTSIGTVFKGNTEITSFDELKKFTGVTSISTSAFAGCSKLSSIDLSNIKLIYYGAFMSLASLNKIVLRDLITVGEQCFSNCANAVFVGGLPPSITTLEYGSNFLNCANLVGDIILPNLINIPQTAFEGTGIERILDLGSVSTLGGGAFNRCQKLTLAILPDTFSVASWCAFANCTALANVVCKAITPPTLNENNNFDNTPIKSGTGTIYVPDASVEAYKTATNWSSFASRIKGISELPTDNAELYNEIKDYLS